MDYSEEATLCRFGTPLEPLEEDEVPSKKPVAIEDQIVTDENGRRRFHGAFTGGFSAGFWNTVGSLEGWKPQSFKSSRSEKAEKRQQQLPTDFMDDEDLGEFGIAPQRIQAREDFSKNDESSSRKRKFPTSDSGTIPGIPVLHELLQPARDKVAVRLLKRMGWKPNQGIGARQTKREKKRSKQQNDREFYVMKMYGCTSNPNDVAENSPKFGTYGSDDDDDGEEEEEEDSLTFAPDDYEPFVCSIKDNLFGLGYSGLSRQVAGESKSHINLFGPLEVLGKSNQKLSIRGQAFGVGALEEEDEDIYARDDMTKYDFSLGDKKKRERAKVPQKQSQGVLEGFVEPSENSNVQTTMHVVDLKANFQPRNWLQRKTRFDPLPEEKLALLKEIEETKRKGLGRHDLNPDDRRNILEGENKKETEQKSEKEGFTNKKSYLQQINEKYKEREDKTKKLLELLSSKEDNFVKGGLVTSAGIEIMQSTELDESVQKENQKVLSEAKKITKPLENLSGSFRPFVGNEAKQERYEKFLEKNLQKEEDIKVFLSTIQPVHLSEWDREMEQKEFIQARNIYKPLNGMMSERFVSKSTDEIASQKPTTTPPDKKVEVVVKRTKVLWKPCSLICKRFNIPEPFGGTLVEPKVTKKNKFSVFDYIENSINSKQNFVTPVIIPKHIEKPKATHVQTQNIAEVKINQGLNDEIASTSKDTQKEHLIESPVLKKPLMDSKRPKTELELRIEESKNKHPSEKKDLFKCIFDSSSEDEETETNLEDGTQATTKIVIPTEIAESLAKPSIPINNLRNHSPPRGIFAALFSKPETKEETTENSKKITFKPKHERIKEETVPELENVYGPKVPNRPSHSIIETKDEADIDKRLVELLSSKPIKDSRILEEWVEKESTSSKKNKKEKCKKKKKDQKKKGHKHKKSKKHKKEKK